jgi:hypothetical protein
LIPDLWPKFLCHHPPRGWNFSWTYLEMCSDICWPDSVEYVVNRITLGIIGNVQSMVEAYLDVFSRCESKFVDPILNRLRNPDRDVYPLLCCIIQNQRLSFIITIYMYLCVCVYIYLYWYCAITCCYHVQAVATSCPCYK